MIRRFVPVLATLLLLLLSAGDAAGADTFDVLEKRFAREKKEAYAARIETVKALAALNTERAARFLLQVVEEDEDRSIQLNTIHQVARIPLPLVFERLLAIYRDGDSGLRSTVFHALTNGRHEALPEAIVERVLAGGDQGARANVVRYLGRRGDPRFLPEAERFLEQFPTGATSLVSVLVAAKTPQAARILVRLYDDARRYDRDQILPVFAAGDAPIRAVLGEVIAAAGRDQVVRAVTIASRAVVAEAEPAMVALLERADTELTAILVEAIGAVGAATEGGREAISRALRDEREDVAVAGVRAARRAPAKASIPLLIALLGEQRRVLAAEARVSLERITGQQYGERIDLWERWWANYGEAFDLATVKAPDANGVDQALVDLAIERGAAALFALQGKTPPWKYASHPVGTTALVVLALHAAGFDRRDKRMQAALDYLQKAPVPETTYDAGLVAMALEALGAKRYRRHITACARRLLETQLDAGLWGYPTGNGDNSNTQYAVLGLRAAARAGVRIRRSTWKKIGEYFLEHRCADGGFSYAVQPAARGSSSMTAAGVSCLLICLENGKFGEEDASAIREVVEEAFQALGAVMKLDKDTLYALYAIERSGVLGQRKVIGGKPWYVPGARRLVDDQGRDGLWRGNYAEVVETAFAILFLKRATVPLAVVTR